MGKIMLIGDKTVAFFDVWSFEHFLGGILLAFLIEHIFPKTKSNLIILLLFSCFWECLEHYLEEGLLGPVIQNWFAGTEYWGNRLIGDNLTIVAGWGVYQKYPISVYFAGIFFGLFLLLHLCCSSSMDVQKFLF